MLANCAEVVARGIEHIAEAAHAAAAAAAAQGPCTSDAALGNLRPAAAAVAASGSFTFGPVVQDSCFSGSATPAVRLPPAPTPSASPLCGSPLPVARDELRQSLDAAGSLISNRIEQQCGGGGVAVRNDTALYSSIFDKAADAAVAATDAEAKAEALPAGTQVLPRPPRPSTDSHLSYIVSGGSSASDGSRQSPSMLPPQPETPASPQASLLSAFASSAVQSMRPEWPATEVAAAANAAARLLARAGNESTMRSLSWRGPLPPSATAAPSLETSRSGSSLAECIPAGSVYASATLQSSASSCPFPTAPATAALSCTAQNAAVAPTSATSSALPEAHQIAAASPLALDVFKSGDLDAIVDSEVEAAAAEGAARRRHAVISEASEADGAEGPAATSSAAAKTAAAAARPARACHRGAALLQAGQRGWPLLWANEAFCRTTGAPAAPGTPFWNSFQHTEGQVSQLRPHASVLLWQPHIDRRVPALPCSAAAPWQRVNPHGIGASCSPDGILAALVGFPFCLEAPNPAMFDPLCFIRARTGIRGCNTPPTSPAAPASQCRSQSAAAPPTTVCHSGTASPGLSLPVLSSSAHSSSWTWLVPLPADGS